MTATQRLSPGKTAPYHDLGYVGPFDLIDRERALALGRVVASRRPSISQRLLFRLPRASDVPELMNIVQDANLLDCVEAILGPNLVVWRTGLFVKRPGDPAHAFHQDDAYYSLKNTLTTPPSGACELALSAWIALDDADLENGCVEVVPGSHRTPVLHGPYPWRYSKAISADLMCDLTTVPMVMQAGQCFLFHSLVVHGSGPNRSQHPRTGLSVRFAVPGVISAGAIREGVERPMLVRGRDRRGRR